MHCLPWCPDTELETNDYESSHSQQILRTRPPTWTGSYPTLSDRGPTTGEIMALFQTAIWACLIGIIAFFVHRELQITSVNLSEEIFIHAKRSDVYPVLMDMEFTASIHPMATGLHDVVKGKTKEGYEEIHFVIPESVTFFGFYQHNVNVTAVLREVQPGVSVELVGEDPGLGINLSWLLVDYKDGDRDGVLLIDRVKYTGMRFVANVALGEAVKAHQAILRKLKEHVEKEHPATQ